MLIPVFLALTIPDATWTRVAAALIFILACATDPLDGYFARARQEVTDFGAIMDPLADKLLLISPFGDREVTISLRMPLLSNIIMAVILVATVWSGFIYVRAFVTSEEIGDAL